jgi:hypothetical protein
LLIQPQTAEAKSKLSILKDRAKKAGIIADIFLDGKAPSLI